MSPASHGSVAALTSGHPRLEPEDESVAGRDGMERLGGTSRRIRFTGFSAGFWSSGGAGSRAIPPRRKIFFGIRSARFPHSKQSVLW